MARSPGLLANMLLLIQAMKFYCGKNALKPFDTKASSRLIQVMLSKVQLSSSGTSGETPVLSVVLLVSREAYRGVYCDLMVFRNVLATFFIPVSINHFSSKIFRYHNHHHRHDTRIQTCAVMIRR